MFLPEEDIYYLTKRDICDKRTSCRKTQPSLRNTMMAKMTSVHLLRYLEKNVQCKQHYLDLKKTLFSKNISFIIKTMCNVVGISQELHLKAAFLQNHKISQRHQKALQEIHLLLQRMLLPFFLTSMLLSFFFFSTEIKKGLEDTNKNTDHHYHH